MLKLLPALLGLFVLLPIWFYLMYKVLEAVDASELMWFLFWIYLPVSFFMTAIIEFSKTEKT